MEPVTEEQPTTVLGKIDPVADAANAALPAPPVPVDAGEIDLDDPANAHMRSQVATERPATILDELVARRDEMAREKHELVLDVPGYRLRGVNRLAVRYRYPEGGAKALAAMEARAVQKGIEDAIVAMQIDYLVACCDEVLTRDDDGELQRLEPNEDAPPLKFGKRLAELFRIEIPEEEKAKARFVCRRVFSPGFAETGVWEGDIVLTGQSQDVQAWLRSIHSQTNEEFSGE
jgi:hypothetical protein